MTKNAGFSNRLGVAIAQAGMKKGNVARAVGLTARSLSRYLTGDRVPHETVLRALALQLSVTVAYLLGTDQKAASLADAPGVKETVDRYAPDAVALTGLDLEERQTVLRLLQALRSGDGDVRRHLIGQLKLIETAVEARRQQPRAELKDEA